MNLKRTDKLVADTLKLEAIQDGAPGKHLPMVVSSGEEPQSDSSSGETALLPKVRTPRAYKVLLLNDDFTPMDFVILVLQKFFKKDLQEAEKVMLEVHHRGAGVAGIYSKEVAEMKVHQVDQFAKSHQHPLKCVMEVE